MSLPARFITFEGIDGAGKSSHIESLAEWLREQGGDVVLTREPGGTPLAEDIRALFLQKDMDALSEALLVFAGRRDHLQKVIAPALQRGQLVLCDRFTDATFAYQGGGRGFDAAVLTQLERWVQSTQQGFLEPQLTLWFDVPARVAAARRAAAREADRLEREDLDFFERVRAGYAARARAAPHRFVRIDGDQAREQVWAQVVSAAAAALGVQG
jgi:dTMP kinase